MTQVIRKTKKFMYIRRAAVNGHHLTLADICSFADRAKTEGAPVDSIIAIDRNSDTLHFTAIALTVEESSETPMAPNNPT